MENTELSEIIDNLAYEHGYKVISRSEIKIYKDRKDCLLGRGAFGEVYKCEYMGSTLVLKKISLMRATEKDIKVIFREMEALKIAEEKIKIINIPKLYGVYKGKTKTGLLMEYIEGKRLSSFYMDLRIEEKLKILLEIIRVIKIIHSFNYIHRDIKPENILVRKTNEEFIIFLIDFGLCKIARNTYTRTESPRGTPQYKSPDVFDEIEEKDEEEFYNDDDLDKSLSVSYKTDIWSFGAMMSEILSGIIPWSQRAINWTYVEALLIQKKSFPIPDNITDPDVIRLIEKCLDINPENRPDGEAIEKELMEIIDNY
jgi:serine/threonine protein kinase